MLRAQAVMRQAPRLSVHDGFAFALAEDHPGCILLTGDGELRTLATQHKIEVHGVLWVIDEIHRNGRCEKPRHFWRRSQHSPPIQRYGSRSARVSASIKRFHGLK